MPLQGDGSGDVDLYCSAGSGVQPGPDYADFKSGRWVGGFGVRLADGLQRRVFDAPMPLRRPACCHLGVRGLHQGSSLPSHAGTCTHICPSCLLLQRPLE